MKQRLLILIALILVSDTSRGQHCAFEDVSIIVVWIHTKDDSSNIPDLKITLVDSQGNTISDRNNNEIVFRKNKEKNQHNGYFLSPEDRSYPFAKDNYIWVCNVGFNVDTYYLRVEKSGPASQDDRPLCLPVKLSESDKYYLCGVYNDREYIASGNRLYKPVEIILD